MTLDDPGDVETSPLINRKTSKKRVKGSAMEASPLPKKRDFYRGGSFVGFSL